MKPTGRGREREMFFQSMYPRTWFHLKSSLITPGKTVPYFPVKLWSPYLMNEWIPTPSILRPFFCTGYLRTTPPNRCQYPPWCTTTPPNPPTSPCPKALAQPATACLPTVTPPILPAIPWLPPPPFAIFMAPGNYMEISGSTRTITPSVNRTRKSSATGSPILTITTTASVTPANPM